MDPETNMTSASDKSTNYYKLLGIDPKSDRQTVKQAYLAKIKEWHPDKNPDRAEEAEEKTKVLNQAYHILGDHQQRKNYDRMLRYTSGKDFNKYINDEAIRAKIDKAYPALKAALKKVRVLYPLFKDAVNGKYKLPPASVAMIGGGLLYFILPADFIPDFIPVAGYLDDLAVLTTIMNSLSKEIREYRIWQEKYSRSNLTTPTKTEK
jgi:curved DNA-binding protein CbpA